ncbi:MAG: hypothetical protein IH933_10820, partial [Euryarchaeota archaeon]|nr:hypothetical protein [Euryarchaeota archaeon]
MVDSYDLSGVEASKKVRFVYLLKGRGAEMGVVEKFGGRFTALGSFMIPLFRD